MKRPLNPIKPAPRWNAMFNGEFVQHCKAMLSIHRFLTAAEAERVQKRIDAWVREHTEEAAQ